MNQIVEILLLILKSKSCFFRKLTRFLNTGMIANSPIKCIMLTKQFGQTKNGKKVEKNRAKMLNIDTYLKSEDLLAHN